MITLFKSENLTIKIYKSFRLFSYRTWSKGMRLEPNHNTKGLTLFFLGIAVSFIVTTTTTIIPTENNNA